MKGINLFYVVTVILGLVLLYALGLKENSNVISFYGFAESEETEINYNFPVVVDAIRVSPGQEVSIGDTLLYLVRKKSKETLNDYGYRIKRLREESEKWRSEMAGDIEVLEAEKKADMESLSAEILALENELKYKKSLSTGLENLKSDDTQFNPIEEKIKELRLKSEQSKKLYEAKINAKRVELRSGQDPYVTEIEQIRAEEEFDQNQKIIPTYVLAPSDGIIGNISCKEEEHVPSYSTLLTFYEPHSAYVRGYVHEDLTLEVHIGDSFEVSSLKDPEITYNGIVTGLGSRIIEIPTRLRKVPQMKSYGREVVITIEKENSFLQKEKVALNHSSTTEK